MTCRFVFDSSPNPVKKRSIDLYHSLLGRNQLGLPEGRRLIFSKATSSKEEEQSKMENLPNKMLTVLMVRLFTFFTSQHFPAENEAPTKYPYPVVSIYLVISRVYKLYGGRESSQDKAIIRKGGLVRASFNTAGSVNKCSAFCFQHSRQEAGQQYSSIECSRDARG